MQFLGSLGIDPKLLIAQMINFALLVWLLSYLVYKPSIKMIEKNEVELEEGQKQKKILEGEKDLFAKEKEKGQAEIKALNKKAIENIGMMTETMRKESQEKTSRESIALLEQTRDALKLEKPMIIKEMAGDLKAKFTEKFRESFDLSVPPRYQAELESVLFKAFIDHIKAAPLDRISETEAKEFKRLSKTNVDEYRKKLEQKFGIISLEYANELSAQERNEAEYIVSEKIGLKLKIETKQDKRLINGLRLEIAGRVIESNLSKIIHNVENI